MGHTTADGQIPKAADHIASLPLRQSENRKRTMRSTYMEFYTVFPAGTPDKHTIHDRTRGQGLCQASPNAFSALAHSACSQTGGHDNRSGFVNHHMLYKERSEHLTAADDATNPGAADASCAQTELRYHKT